MFDIRYSKSTPLILDGIDLEINAGERIGIIGRTGSGKSTLGLLLFRIVEPENGTVLVDGNNCCWCY